jgi:hypothetical protein
VFFFFLSLLSAFFSLQIIFPFLLSQPVLVSSFFLLFSFFFFLLFLFSPRASFYSFISSFLVLLFWSGFSAEMVDGGIGLRQGGSMSWLGCRR